MLKPNFDLRMAAHKRGVCLWQIAERMGMTDGNFSRYLRKELTTKDKQRILKIINDLAEGGGLGDCHDDC